LTLKSRLLFKGFARGRDDVNALLAAELPYLPTADIPRLLANMHTTTRIHRYSFAATSPRVNCSCAAAQSNWAAAPRFTIAMTVFLLKPTLRAMSR